MYLMVNSGHYVLNKAKVLIIKREDLLLSVYKNTDNVNSKMVKSKNGKLQLKSQCSVCGSEKVDL